MVSHATEAGTTDGQINDNDDGAADGSYDGQFDGSSNYPSDNNNENITTGMNTLAPITDPIWTAASIDWCHNTYQTKPTVAAYTQDVAHQAAEAYDASRRAATSAASAQSDIDADDDEYGPTENTSARNLCLKTMRGTLLDFLDTFEAMTGKHAVH